MGIGELRRYHRAEAGIGKMTLYRNYPSKDELIVAFLRASDEDFWDYFEQSVAGALTARGKLLAFLEALPAVHAQRGLLWLPVYHVAVEFPEAGYVGHQVALQHKQRVRARFSTTGP